MGTLETIKTAYDLLTKSGSSDGKSQEKGFFGKLLDIFKSNPEAIKQAESIKENAQNERLSFFSEVGRSIFLRQFPRLAQLQDLGKLTENNEPEAVPWQHEFEAITALLLFVPNSFKKYITDFFAESTTFQTLVKNWPGLDGVDLPIIGNTGLMSKDLPILGKGGSLRERILQQKDPDAVIQALRIMHQDIFVTGKVAFNWIQEKLGTERAIATAAGTVGAVTLGTKILGGESGNLVDQAKEAIGLGGSKKLKDVLAATVSESKTTMQNNILKLLEKLKVTESAEIVKGDWSGNNDYITLSFNYNGKKFFMEFDNDPSSTDIRINNANGNEILNFTDWGNFNTDDNITKIQQALN